MKPSEVIKAIAIKKMKSTERITGRSTPSQFDYIESILEYLDSKE